jgi:hypothetical protein
MLPLGTHTWCYYWEVGDENDDGNMDYRHALDQRPMLLDPSASDDTLTAVTVDLSAPAGIGELPGPCGRAGPNIQDFIVEANHVDTIVGAFINMGHNGDYVGLKGPIPVQFWYMHRPTEADPFITDPPTTVVIKAGETKQFYLEDTVGAHLGDWNMYIELLSWG